MDPLVVCVWIFAGMCALTWVLSLITREYSWVDRTWSLLPIAYMWVFASAAGLADARLDLMAALVTLWGARLTFNFTRKGGYAPGGEDYRWQYLRSKMSRWQFQVFALFFISIYQNIILLAITLPAWTAYRQQSPLGIWDLGAWDVVVTCAFLLFLVAETVADQQQWRFQQQKKARIADGRKPDPRFLTRGMFRYSRHPNFFFELLQWWSVFFFGVIAAGSLLQWTVIGSVLLTALFIGSTIFTESISRSRYPEYADYQRTTSSIVPWRVSRR